MLDVQAAQNQTQPDPVAPVALEVHPAAARHECLMQWRALEARITNPALACSADWTEVWLNHFGDLVPHHFVLGRDDRTGRLIGICLVTEGVGQKDGPLPVRTLHVGTAGEPDTDSICVEYNRPLVEPGREAGFTQQLVEWLQSRRGVDQWQVDGIHEPDLQWFHAAEKNLRLRTELAPWFDLARVRARGTDVVSEFRSTVRRQVRRSLDAYSSLHIEWSRSIDHAADIFGEMRALHQARWTEVGQPGCYASRRFTGFHEELLTRLVPEGRVAFVRVRSRESTLGVGQLLIDRGRAMLYQRGWSTGQAGSPGVVIDVLAMSEALRRGFSAFDFLIPDSQHKRHLSNAQHRMVWAVRRMSTLKFELLDTARCVKHWLGRRPANRMDHNPDGAS